MQQQQQQQIYKEYVKLTLNLAHYSSLGLDNR